MYNKLIGNYEKRVDKGIAWLDKNKPGWVDIIDLKMLDVGHKRVCITGQLFGDYFSKFLDKGIMTPDQAIKHGFNESLLVARNFDLLTAVWYYKIKFRRECQQKEVVKKAIKKAVKKVVGKKVAKKSAKKRA